MVIFMSNGFKILSSVYLKYTANYCDDYQVTVQEDFFSSALCQLSIFFFLPSFLQITLPAKKNPQLLLIQLSSFKLKGKKASPLYTLPINFQENISIL